jgi:hypothetical protein
MGLREMACPAWLLAILLLHEDTGLPTNARESAYVRFDKTRLCSEFETCMELVSLSWDKNKKSGYIPRKREWGFSGPPVFPR